MYIPCPGFSAGIKPDNRLHAQGKQSVFSGSVFGEGRECLALPAPCAAWLLRAPLVAWSRALGAGKIPDAVTKAQQD